MKTLRLIIAFALTPLAAFPQNQNVTQQIATKRVNSDVVIGSGRAISVETGGSITISSGATTSGFLSNASLSGLATGIATITTGTGAFATTSTSSGLAGFLSDETGTGALVFGTSPTIAAPVFSGTFTGTYTLGGTPTFPSSVVTDTGTQTLANKTITAPSITGAVAWEDGTRQTFNPNATNAGLNVGSQAGDPSSPSNGDLWYDSTANELTARINGSNVALGAGGGGGIGGATGSTDNAILRADGTGGSTVQSSAITIDDTGSFTVPEMAAPSTPASGKVSIYAKSDGRMYSKDDAGTEVALGVAGAGTGDVVGPGSATDNALARFDTGTGKLIQNSGTTLSDAGAFAFVDDVEQVFNPGSTNAGLNVGSIAGDPSAPANGAMWYDSTANELTARINGSNVALGSGGGGGTALFVGRSAKTTGYTVVSGDKGYLIDCTSGTFTLALTAAATLTDGFFVGVYNSGSGQITIDPNSVEVIREGGSSATTKVLSQGEGMILFCNGSGWYAVSTARFWYATSSGYVYTDNLAVFNNSTDSSSSADGSIYTPGGVGIAKRINVGGIAIFGSTQAATTTQTGGTRVAGGLGVNGVTYTYVPVTARTSDLSMAANQSSAIHTNEGTTAKVNFTLPAAAANIIFTYIVQDTDGIRVTAASGDTIRIAGTATAAAGYVENSTIGSTLTLVSINATEWIATAVNGTWTFGP